MDADVVVAPCRALGITPIADEALRPLEVDMFDRLTQLLVHDVCKRRGGGRDVGNCKVLLHTDASEENREIEDLGERIAYAAWWYRKLSIAGHIKSDMEEVATHRCEGLGLEVW